MSVVGKEEIVRLITLAKEREEPVVLSPKNLPMSFFCNVVHVDDEFVTLKNSIPPALAPYVVVAESFGLFCRLYWFHTEKIIPAGVYLKLPLPEQAQLGETRQMERIGFSEKENAKVEIQHPFDTGTTLSRRVFDLSDAGMSFRARHATPFLQPGRHLPELNIFVKGKLNKSCAGRVVYIKQIVDVSGQDFYQVGVQFLEGSQ